MTEVATLSSPLRVIMPARNAEATLVLVLEALRCAGFAPEEIVVVDDGSTDRTGEIARSAGARVLRNEPGLGPAEARNRGAAAEAEAAFLIFVDADVAVHPDARSRILDAFQHDLSLDAVFGSYDDAPPAGAVVSRYRNLLHHFVHQTSRREASTFWTGLGAVRRDAFLRVGGFDPKWQDIEDVEFGVRLRRAGGRIRLDRELLGTHLKAWTLWSMLRTDLWGRALPWSRLLLTRAVPKDDLNLALSHRLSAIAALTLAAALVATVVEPFAGAAAAIAAALGFVLANIRFLIFLARRRGVAFALAALPYHLLHHGVAVAGYTWVRLVERRRLREVRERTA